MNINSTEDERYNEIKDRKLTIVRWNESKEKDIAITDSNMTISKKVREYFNEQKLNNISLQLEGFPTEVKLTNKSIKESLHIMDKIHQDSTLLLKLMTVLKPVVENSILIEISTYRHFEKSKADLVKANYQYLGAFCDKDKIYPVKITAEEQVNIYNSNIHMIVTVGQIKVKEVLSPRVQCFKEHESVENGAPSFIVSIRDLIKIFNKNQGIIIKNLPNKMLNSDQLQIKKDLRLHDKKVVLKRQRLQYEELKLKNMKKELDEYEYDYSSIYEDNNKSPVDNGEEMV